MTVVTSLWVQQNIYRLHEKCPNSPQITSNTQAVKQGNTSVNVKLANASYFIF
jgi:hypothetical protein